MMGPETFHAAYSRIWNDIADAPVGDWLKVEAKKRLIELSAAYEREIDRLEELLAQSRADVSELAESPSEGSKAPADETWLRREAMDFALRSGVRPGDLREQAERVLAWLKGE